MTPRFQSRRFGVWGITAGTLILLAVSGCSDDIMRPPTERPQFESELLTSGPEAEIGVQAPGGQGNAGQGNGGARRPTEFPCNTSILMENGRYLHLSMNVVMPRGLVAQTPRRRRFEYVRMTEEGQKTRVAKCVIPDHPAAVAIAVWEFSFARLEWALAQRETLNSVLLGGASAQVLDGLVARDPNALAELSPELVNLLSSSTIASEQKEPCDPEESQCFTEAECDLINGIYIGGEYPCVAELSDVDAFVEIRPFIAYCGPGFVWTNYYCQSIESGTSLPDPEDPPTGGGGGSGGSGEGGPAFEASLACQPQINVVVGSWVSCEATLTGSGSVFGWEFSPDGSGSGYTWHPTTSLYWSIPVSSSGTISFSAGPENEEPSVFGWHVDVSACPGSDPLCLLPLTQSDTTYMVYATDNFMRDDATAFSDEGAYLRCEGMRYRILLWMRDGRVFRGAYDTGELHSGAETVPVNGEMAVHFDPHMLDNEQTPADYRNLLNAMLHEGGHILGHSHGQPTQVSDEWQLEYSEPYFNQLHKGPDSCIDYP